MKKVPKRVLIYFGMLFGISLMYSIFLLIWSGESELAMLPYKLTVCIIGIGTIRAVDDFVRPKIDTHELLKDNPVAYAIYFLAYAIVVAATLS